MSSKDVAVQPVSTSSGSGTSWTVRGLGVKYEEQESRGKNKTREAFDSLSFLILPCGDRQRTRNGTAAKM
jgi:hypothetical protein